MYTEECSFNTGDFADVQLYKVAWQAKGEELQWESFTDHLLIHSAGGLHHSY